MKAHAALSPLKHIRAWLEVHQTKLFWLAVTVVALFAVVTTVPRLSQQPLNFDEGWNLQAPQELVTQGKYASFGAVFDGQTKVFDPYLSTGPAVSLPVAAAFKVFGVGVLQMRLVMLAFFVAAVFLIAWYIYDRTRSPYALLGPLLLLLISSSGIAYRIEMLGEIAGVAYAFGSLIAWRHKCFALAGFLAACAMLSKFLMLLLVCAGFGCFVLWLVARRRHRKPVITAAVHWTLGVGIPLAAWELFRFVQLGVTWQAYKHNLGEFKQVFAANGSGLGSTGTQGLTVPHKFHMLTMNVTVTELLLVFIGLALVIGLAVGYRKLRPAVLDNGYALVFLGLYTFWWFFVSDGGYVRYTLPMFVILWGVVLHMVLRAAPKEPKQWRWAGAAVKVGLAICLAVALLQFYTPWPKPSYALTLNKQREVAQRIQFEKIPHLNHVGWWQNSEMLFLTDMHSTEMQQVQPGETYYLLLGPALRDIVPADYRTAQGLCQQTIFSDSGYIFCTGVKQ